MDRRTFLGVAGCSVLGVASVPMLLIGSASEDGARILFGGDTCHGESYTGIGGTILEKRGYGYSLEALTPLIRRADYAIVNLETPVTAPVQDWAQDKDYVHWSDPRSLDALAASGIDAVGLANNHTLDYGRPGLGQTMTALDRSKIAYFGAGADLDRAAAPLMLQLQSPSGPVKAAVIGMFEYRKAYAEKHGFYAGPGQAGTNMLEIDRFAAQAAQLSAENPGLFIIAYPHWGANYEWRSREQRRLGHALIDSGADMVIGHHGHAMQEVERYRGKWILYGIGNFMFNAPGRYAANPEVLPLGLAVELNLSATGHTSTRLYPILSDNTKTGYRPAFANRDQAGKAFAALLRKSGIGANRAGFKIASDDIGTYLQLG